ncbi:MAG: L,D-transpeptidase family protein [Chloroflexota bacterium]
MQKTLTRRDFLKLTGLGLGALAFNPFKPERAPLALPQFPAGDRLGRIFGKTDIHSEPSFNAPAVKTLYDDEIVVWQQEVITKGALDPNIINQRWAKTPDGYIYAPSLQPVKNVPNAPITAIPNGQLGFWAEVTVPYVDLRLEGAAASPHMKFLLENGFPLRLYYSQVVWIDQLAQADGVIYYRFNENGGRPAGITGGSYGDLLWGEASAFRPLSVEDVAPINPDVDPTSKKVIVDRTENYQTLSCLEGADEVYFCRVSTGQYRDSFGNPVTEYLTPLGEHTTWRKSISIHMSGGTTGTGYDTPAVSWSTLFSGEGYAIHAAFWHNNFGVPRSHGCVNCQPEDAKWIFRWATPLNSLTAGDVVSEGLTNGTHVIVQELTV